MSNGHFKSYLKPMSGNTKQPVLLVTIFNELGSSINIKYKRFFLFSHFNTVHCKNPNTSFFYPSCEYAHFYHLIQQYLLAQTLFLFNRRSVMRQGRESRI